MNSPTLLLSFDIEEFDLPTESGQEISPELQVKVSKEGCLEILALLRTYGVSATFFCTAHFAEKEPELIRQIVSQGHEIASHTYYHSDFEYSHLALSRERLQAISGQPVYGLRMPRMMPVANGALREAGYRYNASMHPTWIPGRYNNLDKPRHCYMEDGLLQMPMSVAPLRIPLFWLAFHNYPQLLYRCFAQMALRKEGYLIVYFHPWEFVDLTDLARQEGYKISPLIRHNCGKKMIRRLGDTIAYFQRKGVVGATMTDYALSQGWFSA